MHVKCRCYKLYTHREQLNWTANNKAGSNLIPKLSVTQAAVQNELPQGNVQTETRNKASQSAAANIGKMNSAFW